MLGMVDHWWLWLAVVVVPDPRRRFLSMMAGSGAMKGLILLNILNNKHESEGTCGDLMFHIVIVGLVHPVGGWLSVGGAFLHQKLPSTLATWLLVWLVSLQPSQDLFL
jgi:hypothetical protein